MPSYLVLISTLGGIAVFGVNGFVIGPLIAAMFLVTWNMAVPLRNDYKMLPPATQIREPSD
jgi:predicted PurR-regulated permease PerM